jgi:flagellar export protein FliJ
MKKFKFTLQTVHNVREMKQETEQLILNERQKEAANAVEQLEKIEAAYLKAIEVYSNKLNCGRVMNIGEMELDALHISALERQKRRAKEILEEKKQACSVQSAKLAAAAREVKITERLRENQALRHRLETDKQEQNAMDELVSANFARKLTTKI